MNRTEILEAKKNGVLVEITDDIHEGRKQFHLKDIGVKGHKKYVVTAIIPHIHAQDYCRVRGAKGKVFVKYEHRNVDIEEFMIPISAVKEAGK